MRDRLIGVTEIPFKFDLAGKSLFSIRTMTEEPDFPEPDAVKIVAGGLCTVRSWRLSTLRAYFTPRGIKEK